MNNDLSPIAKKIKEGIEEWEERSSGNPASHTVEGEHHAEEIAHRKAEELWVGDEEIKRRLPIGHGGPTVSTHQSIGIKWLRDRLFKPKPPEK